MVRTADSFIRTSSGKGGKKGCGSGSRVGQSSTPVSRASSDAPSSSDRGGGNSICHRETPSWQKPITTFFNKNAIKEPIVTSDAAKGMEAKPGCSKYPDTYYDNKENIKDNSSTLKSENKDNGNESEESSIKKISEIEDCEEQPKKKAKY